MFSHCRQSPILSHSKDKLCQWPHRGRMQLCVLIFPELTLTSKSSVKMTLNSSLFSVCLISSKICLQWPPHYLHVLGSAGMDSVSTRRWEGTQPGQPTQSSQRDIHTIGGHALYINRGSWPVEGIAAQELAWASVGSGQLHFVFLACISFHFYYCFYLFLCCPVLSQPTSFTFFFPSDSPSFLAGEGRTE